MSIGSIGRLCIVFVAISCAHPDRVLAQGGADHTPEVFATFPTPEFTENLCEGTDGAIYITSVMGQSVWRVGMDKTVERFASFDDVSGVVGIACADDGFVVSARLRSVGRRPAPDDPSRTVADYSDTGPIVIVLDRTGQVVDTIPADQGVAVNAIVPSGRGTYLLADHNGGKIWEVDLSARRIQPWLDDERLGPVVGANGLKVINGWVYINVLSRSTIYRIAMDDNGKPRGTLSVFAELRTDDFAVADDGTVYAPSDNVIYRVTPAGVVNRWLEDVGESFIPAAIVSRDGSWLYWHTRGGDELPQLMRVALP